MSATKWKHRPCPCGCGELADECMRPASGLNAFRLATPTSEAIHDDYDAPDVCLRCQVDPSMPASCPPCLAEVNAARERDQGATATLRHLRAGTDPMSGRIDPSRWTW